jgi:hypothetical protein
MDTVDIILQYFAKLLLVGGGAAAVAYALFRYLGKNWIESKFAERLQSLKHDQAIELQRLRVQIESMLSGALKLQELEFKVLPEAWKKLDDAFALLSWVTSSYQEYPKIEGMTDGELLEYFSKAHPELLDSQVTRIIAARPGRDRDDRFHELLSWQRLNRAKKAIGELEFHIAGNGLFLPPKLKSQFLEIIPKLRGALISAESSQQFKDYKMLRGAGTDLAAVAPLHKAIEKAIEDRLHSHAKAAAVEADDLK